MGHHNRNHADYSRAKYGNAVLTQIAKIESQETRASDQTAMVSMIERVALDPNASIEKLEKMLDMKERLEARDARRSFDQAIANAKAEIPPILKTGVVDYTSKNGDRTHFTHETLDGIAKVVDPILSRHGLSYRFRSKQESAKLHVTCILAHRDGHFEETTLEGSPDTTGSKNAYQAVGSAATYLQRYTLKLSLGLSAAKDDDAMSSNSSISDEQYHLLQEKIDSTGADESRFLKFFGIGHIDELPPHRFKEAITLLEQKGRK